MDQQLRGLLQQEVLHSASFLRADLASLHHAVLLVLSLRAGTSSQVSTDVNGHARYLSLIIVVLFTIPEIYTRC